LTQPCKRWQQKQAASAGVAASGWA
jgi:hypothetical protein